jgi:formylmethanofuran dehydrogenase subunit E-like metal-binding protein
MREKIMFKSTKDIAREILRAQGINDEPSDAAVRVLRDAIEDAESETRRDAEYDAQMAENFRD